MFYRLVCGDKAVWPYLDDGVRRINLSAEQPIGKLLLGGSTKGTVGRRRNTRNGRLKKPLVSFEEAQTFIILSASGSSLSELRLTMMRV